MSDGTASRIRIEKLRRYSIDPARTGSEGDNTGAAAERAHGMAEDLSRSGQFELLLSGHAALD